MRKLSDVLKGTERSTRFFMSGTFMEKQPDSKPRDSEQRDMLIMTDIKIISNRLEKSKLMRDGKLIRVGDQIEKYRISI
ncbi:hypothetical protein J2W91_004336 [Paenibacillus amylolyticus]|uniref:Uncharacterized protein n=1 Tax=Paenibacillus amylolyticus TaxID=1451 RepID=A0AAP5H8J4_PAEAM|nr:hypothetical protein [Paenibacillus amylolyticus]MDR6725834.1 hypothetical protein [Paenibacillus amylolyticus]